MPQGMFDQIPNAYYTKTFTMFHLSKKGYIACMMVLSWHATKHSNLAYLFF